MIGSKPRNIEVSTHDGGGIFQAWQVRVTNEKSELNEKIGDLAAFLSSEQFQGLHEDEQGRLACQLDAMTVYRSILSERINAWAPPPTVSEEPEEPTV